jgi:hypothetical protein
MYTVMGRPRLEDLIQSPLERFDTLLLRLRLMRVRQLSLMTTDHRGAAPGDTAQAERAPPDLGSRRCRAARRTAAAPAYLLRCTAAGLDTLYLGSFSALDSATEFASDPFIPRNRHWMDDDMARMIFAQYQRDVGKVHQR